jgi:hypothetical protein
MIMDAQPSPVFLIDVILTQFAAEHCQADGHPPGLVAEVRRDYACRFYSAGV